MTKLDLTSIPERKGSSYPAPFDKEVAHRIRQRLGEAGGLTQFGVNLLHLPPGAWSSQRHWHALEDEFVYVISGEIVLITDQGEEIFTPAIARRSPRTCPTATIWSTRAARQLCASKSVRARASERVVYSDIDMVLEPRLGFTHKDGAPYPGK